MDILDHGYVRLVESWGGGDHGQLLPWGEDEDFEAGIVEAARQSTQGSFRGWESDAKLLDHLYTHRHTTPFEFAGMVLEVQAPLMVFREWHRHRTQSYNEMSARYTVLPNLYYLPTIERYMLGKQSTTNKQGSMEGLTAEQAEKAQALQHVANCHSRDSYEQLVKLGVANELARGPVNMFQYSRMRATTDLHNWLHFLRLRMDPKAQWEIRQYAEAVGTVIAQTFPKTWELYVRK